MQEQGGKVIFLRKLVAGGASRSYGIEVARLAGLPPEVVTRARDILQNLESGELDDSGRPRLARRTSSARRPRVSWDCSVESPSRGRSWSPPHQKVLEALRGVKVDEDDANGGAQPAGEAAA